MARVAGARKRIEMWFLSIVVLLVLLIPLTAIVLDSDVGRALAKRLGGTEGKTAGNDVRIEELEKEVRYLSETVTSLQEETQFIRRLLEKPESQPSLPASDD